MGLISLTLPNDGETIDAADVNTPFNTISTVINGNIDNANIKTNAAIDGTKIADNSIPASKMLNGAQGWTGLANNPNTITYNGNRNYDLVFNSVYLSNTLSPGMRLKLSRTVAAPTQCTDLESGSSQYYSKTSPAGMTFTDDFVVSAWVKLESYGNTTIASRYDGAAGNGWILQISSSGIVILSGHNGGASNTSNVQSYSSIPLNKWVHITAQLDMSSFTNTATTSYIMIDGVDVPASVQRSGTNPTALVQGGTLAIGGRGAPSDYFDGKLAQVAIFSAKVTQATMRTYMSQGLSGSETSLISAYSFNGVITDLNTTNANNLTANGSAVATATDSPYANAVTAGTEEYAEINSVTFSTNTTVNVRVPDACMIPTSGGISNVYYAVGANPYGLPAFSNVLNEAVLCAVPSTFTSTAQIPGLSVSVYIPKNKTVKVTIWADSCSNNTSGSFTAVQIWAGAVTTGRSISYGNYQVAANSQRMIVNQSNTYFPASEGLITFNASCAALISGTSTFANGASTTTPAYLRVEYA